jgi:hypothetical protein
MFTIVFWKQAFERAVKTAAQFALVGLGGNFVSVWDADWKLIAGAAAAGAVTSVLTSVGSEGFGPLDSPSIVWEDDLL